MGIYAGFKITMEAITLEKALEEIERIAERYNRGMAVCEVARRVERDRRNTLHAEAATGSNGGGNETL